MRLPNAVLFLAVALVLTAAPPVAAEKAGFDSRVKKPVSESIRIRQETQKQEEQWRDDKQKLIARYEALEREQKQLTLRKRELEEKTQSARTRIADKQKQLADIEEIRTRIIPLIESQIAELHRHVEGDLPFLPEERQRRLERLDALRHDPDVAVSEKFRKVMEALMVEAEYGSTIEVYQQTITVDGRDVLADVFRLGRISLFFQTLDEKACGFYNVAASAWQPLPSTYNRTIQGGHGHRRQTASRGTAEPAAGKDARAMKTMLNSPTFRWIWFAAAVAAFALPPAWAQDMRDLQVQAQEARRTLLKKADAEKQTAADEAARSKTRITSDRAALEQAIKKLETDVAGTEQSGPVP